MKGKGILVDAALVTAITRYSAASDSTSIAPKRPCSFLNPNRARLNLPAATLYASSDRNSRFRVGLERTFGQGRLANPGYLFSLW
jgi:hypothetical protein